MAKAQRWHLRNCSLEHSRVWYPRSMKTETKEREGRKSVVSCSRHECTQNLESSIGQHVFAKENVCNRQLSSVQKLGIRYIQKMLKNSLRWRQKLQTLHSYKRTVKVYYLACYYSFHGHGSMDCLGALSNSSHILSSHFFHSPKFFRFSQCCFERWQRARAESCVIPSLLLYLYQVTHLETNCESTFLKLCITHWLN